MPVAGKPVAFVLTHRSTFFYFFAMHSIDIPCKFNLFLLYLNLLKHFELPCV